MEWLQNPVFSTWDPNTSLWSNALITLYMTAGTMLFATLVGLPVGVLLFETEKAPTGRWPAGSTASSASSSTSAPARSRSSS